MQKIIGIQAATIAQLQMKIEELQAENKKLEKRSIEMYWLYEEMRYEVRGLPSVGEVVKLRLDLLHANEKLKAIEEWAKDSK